MSRATPGETVHLGAPGSIFAGYRLLTIGIDPPLTGVEFHAWLDETFHKAGPARLWGNPIMLGDSKAHIYGLDRASYTRLDAEVTPTRITLVAPPNDGSDLAAIAGRVVASLPDLG